MVSSGLAARGLGCSGSGVTDLRKKHRHNFIAAAARDRALASLALAFASALASASTAREATRVRSSDSCSRTSRSSRNAFTSRASRSSIFSPRLGRWQHRRTMASRHPTSRAAHTMAAARPIGSCRSASTAPARQDPGSNCCAPVRDGAGTGGADSQSGRGGSWIRDAARETAAGSCAASSATAEGSP
eukprot:scaffold2611_cov114-Isochrysis_galbana.AAC.9